jgi:hypothetical protein
VSLEPFNPSLKRFSYLGLANIVSYSERSAQLSALLRAAQWHALQGKSAKPHLDYNHILGLTIARRSWVISWYS